MVHRLARVKEIWKLLTEQFLVLEVINLDTLPYLML